MHLTDEVGGDGEIVEAASPTDLVRVRWLLLVLAGSLTCCNYRIYLRRGRVHARRATLCAITSDRDRRLPRVGFSNSSTSFVPFEGFRAGLAGPLTSPAPRCAVNRRPTQFLTHVDRSPLLNSRRLLRNFIARSQSKLLSAILLWLGHFATRENVVRTYERG